MQPNLNINISVSFLQICNSNISKSKLAFLLSNEIYLSEIVSIVLKLLRLKPEYFFGGHPVVKYIYIATVYTKCKQSTLFVTYEIRYARCFETP